VSRDALHEPAVHRERRQRLLDRLGDGVLVLPTAAETLRNGDVLHEYRPGSDFHFLTGFPEPEAVLVAWRTARRAHRSVLFVRPRDKQREIWDGRRFGVANARRRFGVDEAFPVAELWGRLPSLMNGQTRLFHRLGADARFDRRLIDAFATHAQKHRRRGLPAHPAIEDPMPALASLRLTKDATERDALQRAATVTSSGHLAAMAAARAGKREYEVQAVLEAEFRR
jgi:Xaa-Pro aminopeptidase